MESWAIGDNEVFHTILVEICELKTADEELRKFFNYIINGVNVSDVEATNSGGAGDAGHHNL